MIYTVFVAEPNPAIQWQCDLLEYAWGQAAQPGELVRLTPCGKDDALPQQHLARVVRTCAWSPHPYTGDVFPAYNQAAALFEWLHGEPVDGTVLLLELDSVIRAPITREVSPGQALGTPWPELQQNSHGPFGLRSEFAFLEQFCVNRALVAPAVTVPVVLHTDDLRKLLARWLELMGIMRCELGTGTAAAQAERFSFAVASAEAHLHYIPTDLALATEADSADAPILCYGQPVCSSDGEVVWDKRDYRPWHLVTAERAAGWAGRVFLDLINGYSERYQSGGDLAFLSAHRRPGVREGKARDQTILEIPGRADTLALNASAAAIWSLCDGTRSLARVVSQLEQRHQLPPGHLAGDVLAITSRLTEVGALELRPA